MEILHIRTPYFVAGTTYHWAQDYSKNREAKWGIGIHVKHLGGYGMLQLKLGNNNTIFSILKSKAWELAEKYNSYYFTNTEPACRLAVIPYEAFTQMKEETK